VENLAESARPVTAEERPRKNTESQRAGKRIRQWVTRTQHRTHVAGTHKKRRKQSGSSDLGASSRTRTEHHKRGESLTATSTHEQTKFGLKTELGHAPGVATKRSSDQRSPYRKSQCKDQRSKMKTEQHPGESIANQRAARPGLRIALAHSKKKSMSIFWSGCRNRTRIGTEAQK
jgi:hypothetical protein